MFFWCFVLFWVWFCIVSWRCFFSQVCSLAWPMFIAHIIARSVFFVRLIWPFKNYYITHQNLSKDFNCYAYLLLHTPSYLHQHLSPREKKFSKHEMEAYKGIFHRASCQSMWPNDHVLTYFSRICTSVSVQAASLSVSSLAASLCLSVSLWLYICVCFFCLGFSLSVFFSPSQVMYEWQMANKGRWLRSCYMFLCLFLIFFSSNN